MPDLRLRTPRLALVAATEAHLLAELQSPAAFGRMLEAAPSADWPPGEYDRGAQEYFQGHLAAGGPEAVGWYGWYALTLGPGAALVGAGGFIGPPDERGVVTMGFSMAQAWRGRGYATEMAQALAAWALARDGVQAVEARTSPGNTASRRVLIKCGFSLTQGDDQAEELVYELRGE